MECNYSNAFRINTIKLQRVSYFRLKRFPSANLIMEHFSGPTLTQQELREFWPLRYWLTSTRINKPCMVPRGGGWGTPVSQPAVWNIKGAISEVTRARQWKLHDVSGTSSIRPHPRLGKTHKGWRTVLMKGPFSNVGGTRGSITTVPSPHSGLASNSGQLEPGKV